MRVFASVLATSLALASPAEAAPARVASLNMCTDELLMLLGAPGQIVSVTHLSHQPAEVPWWRQARSYVRNDGSLLSVASSRPDLVLTMGGGGRDTGAIARRLGIRVVDLPYPLSFRDMKLNVARAALALGRRAQGKALLVKLSRAWKTRPKSAADAIFLGGGGRSVSAVGLSADWMSIAGLRQRTLSGDRIGLEQLAAVPPAILLRSDYRAGQYSNEQRWLRHPMARRAAGTHMLHTDGRYWTCLGPSLLPEVARLKRELAR